MKATEFTAEKGNFFILRGDDFHLRNNVISQILQKLPKMSYPFNYARFNGSGSLTALIDYLMMPPQFADVRIAVQDDFNRPFTVTEVDAFKEYISNAPQNRIFVVIDDFKRFAFAEKSGIIVDCSRLSGEQLFKRVSDMAQEAGFRLTAEATNMLIEYCAFDLARIETEIKKLADYKEWNVDAELIEELVPSDAEISVFKFTNAISKQDNDAALALMTMLLRKGNAPLALMALLQAQYRKMFLFSLSTESDEQLAALYGIKPTAVSINRREAKRYTAIQLKNIVALLEEYEFKLKSGEIKPEAALMEVVGKILAAERRKN